MSIKVTQATCIRAELEQMHEQVSERAFELSRMNRSPWNTPEENWFNAQRELIWEPPVEIRQLDGRFEIVAAVAGVEAKDLDIQVAPEALLIKGGSHKECGDGGVVRHCDFSRGQLFRPIHFPEPVDFAKATAECRDGLLRLSVPVLNHMVAEAVEEMKPAARKAKPRKPATTRPKRAKGN